MHATPRHHEVERGFRRLMAAEDLAESDRVEYQPEAVRFFWEGSCPVR
jgi:hypothetical protein